ncbi:hypothetical protein FOZ60_015730 [Perkinsus olseni]|uniref:Uncharacterized protein n=1 Tax=Perkinsus olseni TaxID=32597 RepID=A0A7J6PKZ1_PEROL|nr:hypothetical protein FOZ60_015730 [Perkinsus olseni]
MSGRSEAESFYNQKARVRQERIWTEMIDKEIRSEATQRYILSSSFKLVNHRGVVQIVSTPRRCSRPYLHFQMNHTRPLPPTVTTVTDKVQVQSPEQRVRVRPQRRSRDRHPAQLRATKVDDSSYEIQVMRHRAKVPAERLAAPETSQQEIGWLLGVRSLQLKRNGCADCKKTDCSTQGSVLIPTAKAAEDLPESTVGHMATLNPSRWRYSKNTCDVTEYVDE